jgi:membrane protein
MVSPHASSNHAELDPADPRPVFPHTTEMPPAVSKGSASLATILTKPTHFAALLKSTLSEWNNDNVPRMSAALAYYTIFSLAPLLIIAIAVAGLFFGMRAAQGEITTQIGGLIGRDGAKTVETLIQSAHRPAHSAIASILGVIALLLGASGVFCELQDALNTIWRAGRESKGAVWQICKTRLLSFGMVLGIGFLLLVSLLLSAALAALARYIADFLRIPEFLLHAGDLLFSLFFITLLFAMIFKLLPRAKIAWSDVWLGASLTSLLFTAGKFVIGFYIGKSISSSAYGAAGSLVVVVAWIYYSALLLYFGAEFTRVYANRMGSKSNV